MGVFGVHSIGQISPEHLFLFCSTSMAFLSFFHFIYGSLCKQKFSCLVPSQCSSWPHEELSQSNTSSSPRTEIAVLRWHRGQLTQPGQSWGSVAQEEFGSAAPLVEAVSSIELRGLKCCLLHSGPFPLPFPSREGYRPQWQGIWDHISSEEGRWKALEWEASLLQQWEALLGLNISSETVNAVQRR